MQALKDLKSSPSTSSTSRERHHLGIVGVEKKESVTKGEDDQKEKKGVSGFLLRLMPKAGRRNEANT